MIIDASSVRKLTKCIEMSKLKTFRIEENPLPELSEIGYSSDSFAGAMVTDVIVVVFVIVTCTLHSSSMKRRNAVWHRKCLW